MPGSRFRRKEHGPSNRSVHVDLAAFQLSCRVGADAGYKPVADVRDVVEDETADFRAGRAETAGTQALQRAHGAIQLPREVDFADVAVENRRGWI